MQQFKKTSLALVAAIALGLAGASAMARGDRGGDGGGHGGGGNSGGASASGGSASGGSAAGGTAADGRGRGRGADDAAGDDRGRGRGRGADDAPGHVRGGHGADDTTSTSTASGS